ncbi:MAG TPA: type VI secretion system tip protein TssI/VgrG [Polyangium sp.]|nr:type VI secretion system tip protein TssI/VgrG [Polyangium sp.]
MAREFQAEINITDVDTMRISRFVAKQESGRPTEAHVEALYLGYAQLEELIGHTATIYFGPSGEPPSAITGIIETATVNSSTEKGFDTKQTRYHIRLVSVLALLERMVTSRIFQELSVPDIVTKIFDELGIKYKKQLVDSYSSREYCVQYQEDTLAFISRLCEHEGIQLLSEPDGDGGEQIVLCDDSKTAPFIAGNADLYSCPRAALHDTEDAVYAVRPKSCVQSGKVVLRDYDFERPKLDLTSTAAAKKDTDLELYDYPGGYFDPSEGKRLAKVRLEAEQVHTNTIEVDAICPRIMAGTRFNMLDAGDLDGTYFAFSAVHTYDNRAATQNDGLRYQVRARLVPEALPYRPPRRTPIPVISGPQTAEVVAPEGSPGETIHTDKHGRCKVSFFWDRSGIMDDRASCWMRVSQLQTSGSLIVPRVGWEVIVEFLEGNPDRPIITGRVYNGVFMPPYALPEGKTRTTLKSNNTPGGGGANEIRFEDKAGAEEIMIAAQKDMKVVAANDVKRHVANNDASMVGNNASLEVGANQTVKITKGMQQTIGADQSVSVGGNRNVEINAVNSLNVHGSSTTNVGGNQFEMDGNPLQALLAIAAEAAENFLNSLADNAVANVQSQVEGAINQVMGPINSLNSQVQEIAGNMQAVANGDLGGIGAMAANAAGLPGAADFARSLAGPPPPPTEAGQAIGDAAGQVNQAATQANEAAAQANALTQVAAEASRNALHNAIHQGVGGAETALAHAMGFEPMGGGGSSGANMSGPNAQVDGVDATNREKGPGHATALVGGTHTETIGSLKVLASIKDIDTNVGAAKTQDVGLGTLQLAIGDYSETVGASKTEKALGLVVLTKGGESEKVGGSKTTMVGGAIIDKVDGNQGIEAGGPATFVGIFHKVEAGGSITFKCGGSEVVINKDGIEIKSPIVAFLAPKIHLPQKVTEL